MPVDSGKLGEYHEYWSSGAAGEWVLLGTPGHYLPYNLRTRMATVIEVDELAEAVVGRMLEAGVRIIDSPLPWPPP